MDCCDGSASASASKKSGSWRARAFRRPWYGAFCDRCSFCRLVFPRHYRPANWNGFFCTNWRTCADAILAVRCFQCLVTIVHFANPAVWIANRMIHRLREYACDDMALVLGNASQVESGEAFLGVMRYAASIQHRAEMRFDGAIGLFESTSRASCFERMRRLLDTDRRVSVKLRLGSICVLLLTAALALPQIRAASEPSAEKKAAELSAEKERRAEVPTTPGRS